QIRNGLQITGDLNDETLKSLNVDASGVHPIVKASPTAAPVAPDTSDLRDDRRDNPGPTNPLTGQPFPDQQQDRSASAPLRRDEQAPMQPDYGAAPARPAGYFSGTP